MSLAICRHAELGCTARLSEVTGLSQAVALTRPSVVWLNLQSSLRENCPPWIAIAYSGPDIPTYQAVGVSIAVLKWWTAPIIRKKWKMLRIKPLCALSGTHKLINDEFHPYSPVYKLF